MSQAVRSFQFHQIELTKQEQLEQFNKRISENEKALKSKIAIRKLGAQSLSKNNSEDPLVLNLRGIKTSTDVAEQYIDNLFECLLQNEQEFLDSLATPFVTNPLLDLKRLTKKH